MLGTLLATFHVLLLIFLIALQDKYYYPHFNNERTERKKINLHKARELINRRAVWNSKWSI